jgi:O-antigen biosynthesis protein
MSTTKKYRIFAPYYNRDSGGVVVMHRLCHELNQRSGIEAYLNTPDINPEWNTPLWNFDTNEFIAIYPEIVDGNPFNAKQIVRYVLNNAGKLGGPRSYDPEVIIFAFSELFNDFNLPPEHIMWLPVLNTDIFQDQHLPRSGIIYYDGKAAVKSFPELATAKKITRETTHNQQQLAEIFNHAELFYSFDNITGMTDIARLCGCPTIIIPNGEYTKERYLKHETGWEGLGWGVEETQLAQSTMNSQVVRERYLKLFDTFQDRLTYFIERTQQ